MEENIERQLGLSLPNTPQYPTYRVDNGDNKMGKNATGEFVIKTKNEAGDFEREKFGKELEGVIIASRARLTSRYDENNKEGWWTPEFNPLDNTELIHIVRNKEIMASVTYKQIKTNPKFITSDPASGKIVNNFNYITVLYLDNGKEIVKIELTGRSRGNWIEYSSIMTKKGNSFLKQLTKVFIVENKDGGYECKFKKMADLEEEEVNNSKQKAVSLLHYFNTPFQLASNNQAQLPASDPEEAPSGETFSNEEPQEEIKIEDIPF